MDSTKKSTFSDSLATHSDFMSQGKNRPNKWIKLGNWAEVKNAGIMKHAVGGNRVLYGAVFSLLVSSIEGWKKGFS